MRLPIAREGYPFIAAAAVPAAALFIAAAYRGGTVLWSLAVFAALFALAIIGFFRDPERSGPREEKLILAPADGKVIEITEVDEESYLGTRVKRISIFLSLFDVHVNRYPVSGNVEHRAYDPGKFEPAWRRSASHSNERASTGIRSKRAPVLVRQIAGLAARRIVTYAGVGERVRQGERMGLIRFGSRVDIFVPRDARIAVEVGSRSVGGVTVIAELSD